MIGTAIAVGHFSDGPAASWFGLAGASEQVANVLFFAPLWFFTGGAWAWAVRRIIEFMIKVNPQDRRDRALSKMIERERRYPWMPSMFSLFGIGHDGKAIR
jgi:hypothetical protein